jgi:quinol monooxygenase YgiN
MIHVLASIKVKPGKRDILLEHLKSNIPNVIKEKGCIEYNSTIDVDYQMDNQTFDENMVTIIEKWENFDTLKNCFDLFFIAVDSGKFTFHTHSFDMV